MDPVTSALVEYGALGAFLVFLVVQHIQAQKRQDRLVENFQVQLMERERAHDTAEDLIRQRYDGIMARYEADRVQQFEKIHDAIRDLSHAALVAQKDR
jgi:hypothetical protein